MDACMALNFLAFLQRLVLEDSFVKAFWPNVNALYKRYSGCAPLIIFCFAAYLLTGVAVASVATVVGVWALSRQTTKSFVVRGVIPTSKAELFASEINPQTYWKFARKGYRPPVEVTHHQDG